MELVTLLRKLAKSDYWQTVYNQSKEGHLQLFNNVTDFTDIQIRFIKYLGYYYALFTDIAMGDVSEVVLEDEIYEDSYMLYKSKKDKVDFRKRKNKNTNDSDTVGGSTWLFKTKKK